MRKIILMAALACGGGLCLASLTAYGYTKLNAWRAQGEQFQLGYVVGYLDAAALWKRKDPRAYVPAGGRGKYEEWRRKVNEFYEDPANADRSIPDAMLVIGKQVQDRIMKAYKERRRAAGRTQAGASPTPAGGAPE
jgi:hypothetical protein